MPLHGTTLGLPRPQLARDTKCQDQILGFRQAWYVSYNLSHRLRPHLSYKVSTATNVTNSISKQLQHTVSNIWRTLSCSQASSPSMITTSRVWFWVKLSIVFAILAINSTSHLRTYVKDRTERIKDMRKLSTFLKKSHRKSFFGKKIKNPQYHLWLHLKMMWKPHN